MVRPYLSVVIPAFNEARRLPLTLIDIDRHLSKQEFSYDITVVVSPGKDNTLELLKRFETIIKNLKVIPLIENQGRGLAVKTGMLAAKGNWRLVMDADNSSSIIEFEKIMPYLASSTGKKHDTHDTYDIVIGSRYIIGACIDPALPPFRNILNSISRWLIRTFIVKGISDTSCGFQCFSAATTDKLFSAARANGWALDAEVLSLALQSGYKIKEIPVFWSHEGGTHRTARSAFKIFGEYLRVWWNKSKRS